MSVSLHNTHHMASLGGDPGPWSTWGHDIPPDWAPGGIQSEPDCQSLGAEGTVGSVGLGLLEGAEQEELVVGFGGVWHLSRWQGIAGRRSSRWCRVTSHCAQILPLLASLYLDFCMVSSPCHPTPPLPTHTGEADSSSSTKIEKGETCVQITFCPTLQDQTAFSSSSIMADFVVQYDVVMEDIIGDVRVRELGNGKSMDSGVRQAWTMIWCPKLLIWFSLWISED